MPEVVFYLDLLTVHEQNLSIVLNTAPNLNGIDAEIEITQSNNIVTITE